MATRMTLGSKVCVMAWTGMVFLAVVLAGGMHVANSAAAADEADKVAVELQPGPVTVLVGETGLVAQIVISPSNEAKPVEEPANESATAKRQAIIGGWQAESVSLAAAGGGRKTMAGGNGTISLVLTKDKFTLRTGKKVLLDATYTLDDKQSPCPMDVKSEDGAMLGLCELKDDRLQIALNDVAQGRPKDINQESNGMVLALKRYESCPLWIINADGTNPHEFYSPSDYAHCGSPAWSPDGSKLVFDSIRRLFGEGFDDTRIMVVDAAGSQPKEVGHGVLANWSPDGKKIAFCSYEAPHPGACIMSADGSNVQSIDTGGWGIVWSPKADELAYLERGKLCIYDMKTEQRRDLLGTRYRGISFGFTWSPDGQWICFRGDSEEGQEVAVVHREGEEKGLRVLLSTRTTPGLTSIGGFLAWEPKEGNRIVASLATADNPNRQLFFLDSEGKVPLQRLAGQDPKRGCMSPAWSPDGKRIVYSVRPGVSQ